MLFPCLAEPFFSNGVVEHDEFPPSREMTACDFMNSENYTLASAV